MRRWIYITAFFAIICAAGAFNPAAAQFRSNAFTQSYNEKGDTLGRADTTDRMIDFKEIFGGLAHKRQMRIGSMFGTSLFLPGASQIYNKQYWKLPIFYTGIFGGIAGGVTYHFKAQATGDQTMRNISTWSFVGAGIFYYASLMDGVASYKTTRKPFAGRPTLYSILCPGLGQAMNGEYWKIPIYVGGIVGSVHFYVKNRTNYIRFRDIYRDATQTGYDGPISAEQAKYYRDEYRRYRDYSVVAIAAFYLLQVIDANVFCSMNDFDVSDDIVASITPTVIMPENTAVASGNANMQQPAAGLSLALRF